MFFAVDPSTGVEVTADSARVGWTYRCPTCGARVQVKRGSLRANHFAHLQWAAKRDCENYTPSRFDYRRRPPGEGRTLGPGIATSYMSFSVSVDGPRLAYWIPPAPGANWDGVIEFQAFETSHAFHASSLRSGQRVEFPLVDGRWDVRAMGDVADEYIELLTRGHQSLDAAGTIFDATTVAGRQVQPGQTVAYGQALHWVSRFELDPRARGVRLCAVEKLCQANGWHVYRVQLPEAAYSGDEFMELTQWLERRIRPARPRAWIESPWPRSTTESGFSVYDFSDGELVVCADRPVDIRISDARTGRDILVRFSRESVILPDLPCGVYDLHINDLPHETFVVASCVEQSSAAVRVQVANHESIALAYTQPLLNALIASGRRSVPLVLTWGHPAVGTAVNLNGRVLAQKGSSQVAVLMRPGMRLDAASLGCLDWQVENSRAARPIRSLPPQLRERAAWLLSVACPPCTHRGERVIVPASLQGEVAFRGLLMAIWRAELGPHVRAMSRALSEWQ